MRGDLGVAGSCARRELPWAPRLPPGEVLAPEAPKEASPCASPVLPMPEPVLSHLSDKGPGEAGAPLTRAAPGAGQRGRSRGSPAAEQARGVGTDGCPGDRVSACLLEPGSETLLRLSPGCGLPGTSTPARLFTPPRCLWLGEPSLNEIAAFQNKPPSPRPPPQKVYTGSEGVWEGKGHFVSEAWQVPRSYCSAVFEMFKNYKGKNLAAICGWEKHGKLEINNC